MGKFIGFWCVLMILSGGPTFAGTEGVVNFNLSLGGYRLGMNYEEAMLVRPFVRVETYQSRPWQAEVTAGYVDQVFIDDVEFNFKVEFLNGKIFKIVSHFPPTEIQTLRRALIENLGDGESNVKTATLVSGVEYKIFNNLWTFPAARINLVGAETNTEYGTLSMISDSKDMLELRSKFLEEMKNPDRSGEGSGQASLKKMP